MTRLILALFGYQKNLLILSKWQFRFHSGFTILTLIGVLLFSSLALWQLDRSEQKQQMKQEFDDALNKNYEPLLLNSSTFTQAKKISNYQLVSLKGRYDFSKQILRDNRFYQNQAGFFVLTPFLIDHTDKAVLVNRGWIKMQDRKQFREIIVQDDPDKINHNLIITARVYYPIDRIEMGEYPLANWPAIVQNIDFSVLSSALSYDLLPFTIRLNSDQDFGFVRDWQFTTTTTSEKHQAYALQWFSFTLIALIIYFYKNFSTSKLSTNKQKLK